MTKVHSIEQCHNYLINVPFYQCLQWNYRLSGKEMISRFNDELLLSSYPLLSFKHFSSKSRSKLSVEINRERREAMWILFVIKWE